MKRGMMIVLSGPSGVGKGTIYKKLLKELDNVVVSISATTRQPRVGEVDGVHYHFVSTQTFKDMIDSGQFLEYAETVGNYYGTKMHDVELQLESGKDVILEIDVKGAKQIAKLCPDCMTIFVLPPSMNVLESRLRGRKTETNEQIDKRLKLAESEIADADLFMYNVVNDDLVMATNKIIDIVKKERERRL